MIKFSSIMALIKSRFQNISHVTVLTLVIAIIGGIPGFIGIINHLNKSRLQINFDPERSLIVVIDSDSDQINQKIALILFDVIITGKAAGPSFLKEIIVYLRCNKKWFKGTPFRPKKKDHTLPDGQKIKAPILRNIQSNDRVILLDWENYNPYNSKALNYGEPLRICSIFFFDATPAEFEQRNLIRIEAIDYLNNRYDYDIGKDFLDSPGVRNYRLTVLDDRE